MTSVDVDPKARATHVESILDFAFDAYPKGYFDFVWASPPCTEYSIAKTIGERKLAKADEILEKALEIIGYFDCLWALENPWTGLCKSRPCMAGMSPYEQKVSYCKYGLPFRKTTAIWTNLYDHWQPPPPCSKFSKCEFLSDGRTRHPAIAQQRPGTDRDPTAVTDPRYSARELGCLPEPLCVEIAEAAHRALTARSPVAEH